MKTFSILAATALLTVACSEQESQTTAQELEVNTFETSTGESAIGNGVDDGEEGTVVSRALNDAADELSAAGNGVDDGEAGTVVSRAIESADKELEAVGNGVDDGEAGTAVSRGADNIAEALDKGKTSSEATTGAYIKDTQ